MPKVYFDERIAKGYDADTDMFVDLVGPMPYADFQCMIDDPPGHRNYWTAEYHDDFPDDALDVFVKYGFERRCPVGCENSIAVSGLACRSRGDA